MSINIFRLVLDGEYGHNPYFEKYLKEVRNNQKSIATRGEASAFVYEKRFKHLEFLKSFFAEKNLENSEGVQDDKSPDKDDLSQEVFCLTMAYLTSQEFYHQLVLNPFMNALKKSGLMNKSDTTDVQKTVQIFIDQYSAHLSKKTLMESSEKLEVHFNRLMLGLIENPDFMANLTKAKEANSMVTFLASLDMPKEEDKIEYGYILKKMSKTAEGLGLGVIEELIYSDAKNPARSLLSNVYDNAEQLYHTLSEEEKADYVDLFSSWGRQLQANKPSNKMAAITDLWLDHIGKKISKANFLHIAEKTGFKPSELKTYQADRRVVVIYKPRDARQESFENLKSLAELTLPQQKIISIDNPKDLARSIMLHRNQLGYLLIPDGDLESYYQDIKEIKPAIDDAVRNCHWHIMGVGAGGSIFADYIIENLGNARHVKKGLGLIPSESGEVMIPNGKFINLDLPETSDELAHMENKGDYIKVSEDAAQNAEMIGSYDMDASIGSAILSYQLEGSTVFFSSPLIESFLSKPDPGHDDDYMDLNTMQQSLEIWYRFLDLSKAKEIS